MNEKHIKLLRFYCSEENEASNLVLMFERGEIPIFKNKHSLKEAANLLLEMGYVQSMNYDKYTVFITDKGSSVIQQSKFRIRWYILSEFVKSKSDKIDRSNILSNLLVSLLTLFVFWILNIIQSWF